MPKRDGTGPWGQRPGKGRVRGSCAVGRGNVISIAGQRKGRRNRGNNNSRDGISDRGQRSRDFHIPSPDTVG